MQGNRNHFGHLSLGASKAWARASVGAFVATLLLTGCFQNLSSSTSGITRYSNNSNFTDTGGGGTGGFDGATIIASTASGGLVGSYANPSSPAQLGLMVNLQAPIVNSITEATLNDLLNRVDTDASVQNIDVVLQIPQFGIQVKFKFSKIAYGNNKYLRNVLSIRPNATGADVSTGYIPDTAPIVQQTNGYIFSYGGLVESTPISRLTVFYRSDLTNGTGFLPNRTSSSWGVGFPDNSDPQGAPILLRMTANLANIYSRLFTDPNTGLSSLDDNFKDIKTNYGKYLLAIHLDPAQTRGIDPADGVTPITETDAAWYTRAIKKAYVIVLRATDNVPLYLPFCSAAESSNPVRITDPGTTNEYEVASKLACDCDPMDDLGSGVPAVKVFETCGARSDLSVSYKTAGKLPFLIDAITNTVNGVASAITNPATPRTGSYSIGTVTANGFTLSPYSP